jgi:hypothetical protein
MASKICQKGHIPVEVMCIWYRSFATSVGFRRKNLEYAGFIAYNALVHCTMMFGWMGGWREFKRTLARDGWQRGWQV